MTKSTVDDGEPTADMGVRADVRHNSSPQETSRPNVPIGEAEAPPMPRKRVFLFAFLLVAVLLGYGGFKHWQMDQRATEAQQDAIDFVPEVETITAKADGTPVKLTLPGQTEAFNVATIFPRATGYVADRHVDIGSRVKAGDLLIRIASPDLDQQLAQAMAQLQQTKAALAQAEASLDQSKAALALAKITFSRTNQMAAKGYETVQNNDNQRTQVQSQQANVEAAEAGIKVANANIQAQQSTVDRLTTLTKFEEVRAPFDGIVTTRGVETGDLVNADSKTGTPLFTVARDKVLRVTVHVPQANAFAIYDGLAGQAYLPQMPNKVFAGKIARSSVALLNSARTLDTEVDVENPRGELKPGAFVNVTFDIPRERPAIVVPAETLIFNQKGLQVAVVQDSTVRMQKVVIERDFGSTVELREGLAGGEQIVKNPPPELADNAKVRIKDNPPTEQANK